MRFGETAESIKIIAEERRQGNRPVYGRDESLLQAQPDIVQHLNGNDGSGNNRGLFVLGLHKPFDTNTIRPLAGS